ncbi:hypothetical protein K1719_007887 [Acacia pycnantha]|nr:hypothetical protein K1719_007887 [Acacia pycnantha]
MAIDLCSKISSTEISPRISFSHDLKNAKDDDDCDDPLEDYCHRFHLIVSIKVAIFLCSKNKTFRTQMIKASIRAMVEGGRDDGVCDDEVEKSEYM